MQKIKFSIEIKASKEKVWSILWEDKAFRDWANIIDEGTYLKGEMKEGNEVQFISSSSGYGVTSLVEKLEPNKLVIFRQMADTKDMGENERDKQWTGGKEMYSIEEKDGITTLTIQSAIPTELEEIFKVRTPKAMERIKELTEKTCLFVI